MEEQLPPYQVLSDQITKNLIAEGLIKDDECFKQLLIEGKVKDSDWKLAFENVIKTKEETK